jgi:hypothetical protein
MSFAAMPTVLWLGKWLVLCRLRPTPHVVDQFDLVLGSSERFLRKTAVQSVSQTE